ncbi:uncharacterized protein AFUA_1G14820 [Aspergillus fumigatus Af293]|uniref:Uncharacterized protein n=2 Tax=Aspergillus fumigatus TaxID=746128 RepID=Q4WRW9_ASPFU|nr:hypothetical protein AFUA_1G14820 [Aspergillus fumigatus Af293]EAL90813.1 hypothetical protein AFUA_1G14820 [Aspergillus fumigatus Af293]EDP56717.1 hypothetical protein AFUB_014360 [Aspergillus fumigatus A1163]
MTIGHPQNPYQKWFSGHHRAEDSKHWLRFETLRPLSALRQDDSSPHCLVTPIIVTLQLPLVDHGPRRSDSSISSILSPVLSVCA